MKKCDNQKCREKKHDGMHDIHMKNKNIPKHNSRRLPQPNSHENHHSSHKSCANFLLIFSLSRANRKHRSCKESTHPKRQNRKKWCDGWSVIRARKQWFGDNFDRMTEEIFFIFWVQKHDFKEFFNSFITDTIRNFLQF